MRVVYYLWGFDISSMPRYPKKVQSLMSQGEAKVVVNIYHTFLSPAKIMLISYIFILYTGIFFDANFLRGGGEVRDLKIGEGLSKWDILHDARIKC